MTETNEVVRWFIGSLCQIVFHLTLKEIVFDVILMDLSLPDYHGYDLANEIHQLQVDAKMFVVSGNEPEPERMKELGIEGSLLKPVSREDLISLFDSL